MWMLFVLNYGVLKGTREIVKKKNQAPLQLMSGCKGAFHASSGGSVYLDSIIYTFTLL